MVRFITLKNCKINTVFIFLRKICIVLRAYFIRITIVVSQKVQEWEYQEKLCTLFISAFWSSTYHALRKHSNF